MKEPRINTISRVDISSLTGSPGLCLSGLQHPHPIPTRWSMGYTGGGGTSVSQPNHSSHATPSGVCRKIAGSQRTDSSGNVDGGRVLLVVIQLLSVDFPSLPKVFSTVGRKSHCGQPTLLCSYKQMVNKYHP